MSQYTISIKSIINLNSHLAPYNDYVFADTAKKLSAAEKSFSILTMQVMMNSSGYLRKNSL